MLASLPVELQLVQAAPVMEQASLPAAVDVSQLVLVSESVLEPVLSPVDSRLAPSDGESTEVDEEIVMEGSDDDILAPSSLPRRGRGAVRSASPGESRRRSWAARMPSSSPEPPSSPTSVLPSSSPPKASSLPATATAASARLALGWLAPSSLASPSSLIDMTRPPGFESSPTVLVSSASPDRTPVHSSDGLPVQPLAPLFSRPRSPLISPPMSSPPVRPTARRKTLAGVDMVRTVGFSLRRTSARLREKRKAVPVAKKAEALVCKGLGIIQDGEEVTEQAMNEFARRFDGQVPENVLAAIRALFKVGSPEDDEFDEALIRHGGAAALDIEQDMEAATANVVV